MAFENTWTYGNYLELNLKFKLIFNVRICTAPNCDSIVQSLSLWGCFFLFQIGLLDQYLKEAWNSKVLVMNRQKFIENQELFIQIRCQSRIVTIQKKFHLKSIFVEALPGWSLIIHIHNSKLCSIEFTGWCNYVFSKIRDQWSSIESQGHQFFFALKMKKGNNNGSTKSTKTLNISYVMRTF